MESISWINVGGIAFLTAITLALIVIRNRQAVFLRLGARVVDQPRTEPRQWPVSGREVLIWGLPYTLAQIGLLIVLVLLLGLLIWLVTDWFVPLVTRTPSIPESVRTSPEFDWAEPKAAPVVTPVATVPVSSPAPPVNYRQEWVRLMNESIEAQYRASPTTPFVPENLEPVATLTLEPNEVRFAGQVLDVNGQGHVWLTLSGDRKNLEFCGSVHQNKWFTPDANPCRVFSEPGADALLVRHKPGATSSAQVTAERVTRKGQRDRTDVAVPLAVRKIYRNVPGQTELTIADTVPTALPGGQRVECTVTVLLFYSSGGRALDPATAIRGIMAVSFDGGWQEADLKFEATTVGKNNPRLLVSPCYPGLYDIVVVLTPL